MNKMKKLKLALLAIAICFIIAMWGIFKDDKECTKCPVCYNPEKSIPAYIEASQYFEVMFKHNIFKAVSYTFYDYKLISVEFEQK